MKNRYIRGDHNVICDLSGAKLKRSQCRLGQPGSTIAGLLVDKELWSPRHPQLDIRPRQENIAVRDARPRSETQFMEGQGPNDSKIPFGDE